MEITPADTLTLNEAQSLYRKFSGKDGDEAARAMLDIARQGEHQQVGWSRLRLLSLRDLGRYLILNGRPRGRPAKMSDTNNIPTLAALGINDRNISVNAKLVARIAQKDFDRYMADESEPTLEGLRRCSEQQPSRIWAGKPLAWNVDAGNSSAEYYAPPELFDAMGVTFDLDVCSPGAEVVPWIPAKRHLTKLENGLVADWDGFCWMNPPYGLRNGLAEWVERFVEHANGVALVSDFTSTLWWSDLTSGADTILALRPKLVFVSERKGHNDLGSTLVAYGERGVTALRNAERAGRGICFYRSAHFHEENARLREEIAQLHGAVDRLRAAIRRGGLVDAA
jgi:hypothetical protein